jgi:hypothetical protein
VLVIVRGLWTAEHGLPARRRAAKRPVNTPAAVSVQLRERALPGVVLNGCLTATLATT